MKKLQSNLLLLVTAMIWGFAFAAQRMGADHIQPFSFNGIRFTLGAVSLIPLIYVFIVNPTKNISAADTMEYAAI